MHLVIEPEETVNGQTTNGMGLRYLTVRAVDKQGRTVPTFDEELTVTVEGTGLSLLAIDNGDHYTDYLFHGVRTKRMLQGQMQVILRTTRQPGKVTLRATTPSLKATLKL